MSRIESSNQVIKLMFATVLSFFALALLLNRVIFKFPSSDYIYLPFLNFFCFCGLVSIGLKNLIVGYKDNYWYNVTRSVVIFYGVVLLLQVGAVSIQHTPFPTIDHHIVAVERMLHFELADVIGWTQAHSQFKNLAEFFYNSLAYQIIFLPIAISILGHHRHMDKVCLLLLISAFIGFAFYYIFPTAAPSSIIQSPYFSEVQRNTSLKFWELHHYIQPHDYSGGLIAMPSFHVIWCLCFVYMLRPYPIACLLLFIYNLGVYASCVLLGWHYLLDILASILVFYLSFKIYDYLFEANRHTEQMQRVS